MNETPHPARTMPYDVLVAGLEAARERRMVYDRIHPETGLQIWCYTGRCNWDDGWDEFTVLARGLILDPADRRVVATPFPKFFNYGEKRGPVPPGEFEAYEKVDGSMITVYHHAGRWWAATKGSFVSDQGAWAQARVDAADTSHLDPGTSYLAEAVYADSSVVVRYEEDAMRLLAAYAPDGYEVPYGRIAAIGDAIGWPAAKRVRFANATELVATVGTLTKDEEGFVVRYPGGTRLKVKGAGYRRIHAIVSRCTPLAVWEVMTAGDDLDELRREMPEELWTDFDGIRRLIGEAMEALDRRLTEAEKPFVDVPDRDLAPLIAHLPNDLRSYMFAMRRGRRGDPRYAKTLLKAVRPTGDVLPGYVPSHALERIMGEIEG